MFGMAGLDWGHRGRRRMQEFPAKKVIFREGQLGNLAYVIREGAVQIVKSHGHRHGALVLATLGPGEVFGEMALIDGGRRLASAIALADTKCSVIRSDTLEEHLDALAPGSRARFETMIRYVRETLPWEERRKDPRLAARTTLDRDMQEIMDALGDTLPGDFSSRVLRALYKIVTRYVRERLPAA